MDKRQTGEVRTPHAHDPMKLWGKRVLVIGLARSGVAAAELLLSRGARVTVADKRSAEALGESLHRLQHAGARAVLGEHAESLLLEQELIVVSPGVPRDLPALQAARQAGVEIIGELELAWRHLTIPVVAITGTNGKSTTTTFTGNLLRGAGRRVFVGGNLGTPLCKAVDGDHDWAVVEVSSFQLEWAPTFRPKVALLLNVTEDHLDRYRDFEDYAQTKALLFSQQGEGDVAIVNFGDSRTIALTDPLDAGRGGQVGAPQSGPERLFFGHGAAVPRGIRHVEGALELSTGSGWQHISLAGFMPRGRHNIENLMAAFLAAQRAGAPVGLLQPLIPQLEGLPHRLEPVRTLGGVTYYNDSKATNVDSVVCSLRDMTEPLVLLMGGRDKGGSYAPLASIVRERVRTLVLFGEAAPLIEEALGGLAPVQRVADLSEAIQVARSRAVPGDSVVLSPACSSYDQFPNYEVRGQTFKRLVLELPE